jgi:hypothetical protein
VKELRFGGRLESARLTNLRSDPLGAASDRMGVSREHGLDLVPCDLSQVSVVNPGGAQVGDTAVAALVGADV